MNCPTCDFANPEGATMCASCSSPLAGAAPATGAAVPFSPSLPIKSTLQNGAFTIGQVLGQGGFGITYKGGDMSLRRFVAIKEFFPHGSARQGTIVHPPHGTATDGFGQARQGFLREAVTLARFNHPGIVRVFGAFEENNTAYMVMELLEGTSLQKRLEEKGVLPEKDAVRTVTQIGQALAALHEVNLLHRDIKPDNIILVAAGTPEERAVLIDFGTAREFAAEKTKTMTAMLTPGYAPLEQYGKQAKFGPYTDVYALGATLYHCLTGQLPVSVMDRVAGVELPPPDQINPNLSRGISNAVMWALQVKASDRPQQVGDFLQALKTGRVPGASPATSPSAAPNLQPPAKAPDSWPQQPAPSNVSAPGTQHYSQVCPHCGAKMSLSMTICPSCLHRKTAPAGSAAERNDLVPLHLRPDTPFDTFMTSISAGVWRALGILTLLLIAARIGLGVVRYQNGGRDFGEQLALEVMKRPEAAPLREAKLHLGEGTYDEQTQSKRHDDYVGTVRYRDGDAGTLTLQVKNRDWLYCPVGFSFAFQPADFGSLIAGRIRAELNQKLRDRGSELHVTDISLSRVTRTQYQGRAIFDDDFKHPVGVSATVQSFSEDGSPATWLYSVE